MKPIRLWSLEMEYEFNLFALPQNPFSLSLCKEIDNESRSRVFQLQLWPTAKVNPITISFPDVFLEFNVR